MTPTPETTPASLDEVAYSCRFRLIGTNDWDGFDFRTSLGETVRLTYEDETIRLYVFTTTMTVNHYATFDRSFPSPILESIVKGFLS